MAVITLAVHATVTVKYLSSLISTCNCASIKHLSSATLLLLQQLPRLDSAHRPGHPSVGRRAGAMSSNQRAVMLCGWVLKAVIICVWVAGKTVHPLANIGHI